LEEGEIMLINHTHERLVALGLAGMAKAFDDQQRQPDVTALTFEQRLGLMIDREATERDNKRFAVRLKFASLRQAAVVEDADARAPSKRSATTYRCGRPIRPNNRSDRAVDS
jgi:IstB-like ATP binding protein